MNLQSEKTKTSASYLKRLYRRSGLFRWQLKPPFRVDVNRFMPPSDPWRGSAQLGGEILHSGLPSHRGQPEYFSFDWLRNIRDFGGDTARIFARDEISFWLSENTNWDAESWHPKYLGNRLCNLIFAYKWYANSASQSFQNKLLSQLAVESQCLALDWQNQSNIDDQVAALRGLLVAQSAFNANLSDMRPLLEIFERKLGEILNEDGGHISRRPETHFKVMTQLFECRVAIAQGGTLIYTSCSLQKQEGEEVLEALISNEKSGLILNPIRREEADIFYPSNRVEDTIDYLRILPNQLLTNGTDNRGNDGFFIARLTVK